MRRALALLVCLILMSRVATAQAIGALSVDARFIPASMNEPSQRATAAPRSGDEEDPCEALTHGEILGAAAGAVVLDGYTLGVQLAHRGSSFPPLAYAYVGAVGGGLGTVMATTRLRMPCVRARRYEFREPPPCSSAMLRRGLQGSAAGAYMGFLVSPLLILPEAIFAAPNSVNWGHAMGVGAAIGAIMNLPVGLARGHQECHPPDYSSGSSG